jgi:hypothetical protein
MRKRCENVTTNPRRPRRKSNLQFEASAAKLRPRHIWQFAPLTAFSMAAPSSPYSSDGNLPRKPGSTELLASAQREAIWIVVIWCIACGWSIGVCGWLGYGRPNALPPLVFGFPNWVFWGVVVPWLVATVSSLFISQVLMTDEDLGEDAADDGRDEDAL